MLPRRAEATVSLECLIVPARLLQASIGSPTGSKAKACPAGSMQAISATNAAPRPLDMAEALEGRRAEALTS